MCVALEQLFAPQHFRAGPDASYIDRKGLMKEFACGDVVPGCVAKFAAGSSDEILERVAAHARDDHGMSEVPADVVAAVLERIHDAPAA